MKSFHDLRKKLDEAGMYGMTPDMLKKAKAENPLKGKGYPYNEMSAKAHYKKYQSKFRVPPIDKNRYPNREREGLEGPYRSKKSGKVFYYDKKAGKYYDTDSDMYLSVNDVMESVEMNESFMDYVVTADDFIQNYVEKQKAKSKDIVATKKSVIGKTAKFAVLKNPAFRPGSRTDEFIMVTMSDPARGRVKMFAFHGTHPSKEGALKFATNRKLAESVELDEAGDPRIAKMSRKAQEILAMMANSLDTTGGPYLDKRNVKFLTRRGVENTLKAAQRIPKGNKNAWKDIALVKKELGESVELDEYRRQDVYAIVDKKGKVVASKLTKKNAHKEISRHRNGTIVLDPDAKDGDILKTFAKESVELDEDNTAAVAKQVKQAVKKHTTGKLVVRSKGGKSRFIMVRADSIDNKLRKMVLDVVAPNANVRDKSDISYGNISSNIISASVEQWMKALGIKEGSLGYKKALRSRKKNPDKEKKMDLRRWSAEKKKRNKKIHSDVQSEDIANTAGSGAVAGLGDEPPVSKAAQKKKQRSGGATGGIPAPKKGDLIPPALGESTDTFAGCRVFEVEDEEYGKALYGRQKYERWNKKFDMTKETNQMIQKYANRNPGKGIVVKNKKTGDMSYLINRKY